MSKNPISLKTKQKAHEEEKTHHHKGPEVTLQERGLQLEAIIKAFDGLIYLCSQNYIIEFMNEKYIERIGYPGSVESDAQRILEAISKKSFVPISVLGSRFNSSKYFSMSAD